VNDGEGDATIEKGFAWLEANQPAPGPTVLAWGDAQVGNLLLGADLGVTAVLNWELAGLAPRELDLAWFLLTSERRFSDFDRAAAVARYTKLTGHQVRNLEFHDTFAALRLAIRTHRTGASLAHPGTRCA
jgi:aminoglycoside phosphotransferase (APT) family kinase protein